MPRGEGLRTSWGPLSSRWAKIGSRLATVRIGVQRATGPGRKIGTTGRNKPTKRLKSRPTCTRFATIATSHAPLSRAEHASVQRPHPQQAAQARPIPGRVRRVVRHRHHRRADGGVPHRCQLSFPARPRARTVSITPGLSPSKAWRRWTRSADWRCAGGCRSADGLFKRERSGAVGPSGIGRVDTSGSRLSPL
jgi:hypothetical protein